MPAELDAWVHGAGMCGTYPRYSCSLFYFCQERGNNCSTALVAWPASAVKWMRKNNVKVWQTTLHLNLNDFCKMIINEDADGDNDYTIRNML